MISIYKGSNIYWSTMDYRHCVSKEINLKKVMYITAIRIIDKVACGYQYNLINVYWCLAKDRHGALRISTYTE